MATRTVNPSGGADYSSLNAAEAALPATFTEAEIIECQGTAADTTAVTFTGFAISSFSLTVRAATAAKAGTAWSTSKYRHTGSVGFAAAFVIGAGIDITIDGLQIENTNAIANGPRGVGCNVTTNTVTIQRCYIRHASGTSDGIGVFRIGTGAGFLRVRNTIIDRFSRAIGNNDYSTAGGWIVYNCTFVRQGSTNISLLDQDGGVKRIKNVICQDAAIGYETGGGTNDVVALITADATSPNVPFRNLTVSFAGADDFALNSGDTAALDNGTDLSGDATWAFSDDILGNARVAPWDIGAHEIAAATLEQEGFRWRNDDGSETTATWAAAQDTNLTAPVDTPKRLRLLVNATGDPASIQYQLEYRIAAGTWRKVE